MDFYNFPDELDKKWFDEAKDIKSGKEKRAEFIKALKAVMNTWQLADWRYELGLDPNNPKNSHWMTRYINRELTKRKEEGNEASVRNRFWISTIIAILSVLIAFTSFLFSASKKTDQVPSTKVEKTINTLNNANQPTQKTARLISDVIF